MPGPTDFAVQGRVLLTSVHFPSIHTSMSLNNGKQSGDSGSIDPGRQYLPLAVKAWEYDVNNATVFDADV